MNNRVPLSFLLSFIRRRPLVMQTWSRVRFHPTLTQGKMTHAGDKRNRVIARLLERRIIVRISGAFHFLMHYGVRVHLQRVIFLSRVAWEILTRRILILQKPVLSDRYVHAISNLNVIFSVNHILHNCVYCYIEWFHLLPKQLSSLCREIPTFL